ncbi:MAG: purine-nucleoside phosphorylase [Candidatus Omnitrophica bacterium]|nr:purine-nucleoside phosphorylase [Candidatus Omnitrophota bacterium]
MKRIKKTKTSLLSNVQDAVRFIRRKTDWVPEIAVILGTGLGNFAKKIKLEAAVDYNIIPHFPVSTVESHAGKLLLGTLAGKKVAAMEGRFHFYEGYTPQEVTFPVRVLRELGAKILVVSNAAGGLNLAYRKGEIVVIEDHINFMGINPLIGPNEERLGPRFPDMCAPFSARLAGLTEQASREQKIPVRRGVYVGVAGPNLETRAEYRMLRGFGADLVGMSTVPEVIVGVHMGMEILGLSIVTDVCDPDHLEPCDIKEIIKTANEAGPRLDKLLEAAIRKF